MPAVADRSQTLVGNEVGEPLERLFRALQSNLGRNGPQGAILSIWEAWPQILPEWACEVLFCTSGQPGPRRGQNEPQGLILSISAAWPQISPEWVSEGPLSENAPDIFTFKPKCAAPPSRPLTTRRGSGASC